MKNAGISAVFLVFTICHPKNVRRPNGRRFTINIIQVRRRRKFWKTVMIYIEYPLFFSDFLKFISKFSVTLRILRSYNIMKKQHEPGSLNKLLCDRIICCNESCRAGEALVNHRDSRKQSNYDQMGPFWRWTFSLKKSLLWGVFTTWLCLTTCFRAAAKKSWNADHGK